MTTSSKQHDADVIRAWQDRGTHAVTCPSGVRLKIVLLGLATLLQRGEIPDALVTIAMAEFSHELGQTGVVKDMIAEGKPQSEVIEALTGLVEFQRWLACKSIVAIEHDGAWHPIVLEPADSLAIPEDDLGMVAEIVQRERNRDARGVTIGVEPLQRWATFREEHGCSEDGCEACTRVVAAFSSVDVGEV
jgi:hypothetical protein